MCSLVINSKQCNTVHVIVEMLFVTIIIMVMKLTMNAVKAFQTYQNKVAIRHFASLIYGLSDP